VGERQLKRGDIFVTRSNTPYELDWKSPVGEEVDFIIIHLALDQFLAASLRSIDFPRQESLPQRAPGDEADPGFLDCRQHFRFRIFCPPPRRKKMCSLVAFRSPQHATNPDIRGWPSGSRLSPAPRP
jgi:hypothetical protein